MFDKIQMILMMKTTISNNRISRLKPGNRKTLTRQNHFVIEKFRILNGLKGWKAQEVTWGVLYRKLFLKILQNLQENTCARLSCLFFFSCLKACNFMKKQTLAQLFSCEYCKIFQSSIFYRAPPVAASAFSRQEILSSAESDTADSRTSLCFRLSFENTS